MPDLVSALVSYCIMLGFLLLPLYVAKQMVPRGYRLLQRITQRIGKPLMKFLTGVFIMTQVKRRGWLHGLLVHVPLVCALVTLVAGIFTSTIAAILAALLCVAVAFGAIRLLGILRGLHSRRSRLPGWRR